MKNNFNKYFGLIILLFSGLNYCNTKIYVNSIPKCGTHLLSKCISLITRKNSLGFSTDKVLQRWPKINNDQFFHCHLPYSLEIENKLIKENYKSFFIYRDPRDQIVSHAFWILENPERYHSDNKPSAITSNDISQIIDHYITIIDETYGQYLPWLKSSITLSVKFEDLIGNEGNGSIETQKQAIQQICSHLKINNIKLNYTIDNCMKNLFGGTETFRKGQIGGWKKYFNKKQKNKFKEIAGQLLIDLRYEKDLNW